ncbi:MAG: DsbA family protein [Lyngbya sp. HA4199-MV5]|jgi:protein-disulfide isomerase|nr:DsbA family protein [Lyngbya sp. HA4199-MV5]
MNPTDSRDLMPPLRAQDHIQGSINAAIVLVEYCDYQCSDCGQAHHLVQNLQRQLGEQLCYVFRHFPLPHHPQALRAAEAAEAAHAQEKFWQMHSILFEQQQTLDDADLVECAAAINLGILRFLRELSTRVHIDRIQADIESGCSNGVEETPTFFINVCHRGTQNLEALLLTILRTCT